MGSAVETNSSKSVIRMLQHSILQLCNEHVGYSNRLQILGVLCMTIDEEPHELVVKVNNTLKRVGQNGSGKEGTPQAAQPTGPTQPLGAPSGPQIPIDISPIPSHNLVQNLTKQFQNAQLSRKKTALGSATNQTGLPFTTTADSLIAQAAVTPVSVPNGETSVEDHTAEGGVSGGEKKSQGRKGRKPTKVHHVYDEGEFISNGDDINDDVLTVIPTDPDQPDEDMETLEITTKDASDAKNPGASGSETSQSSIMRQVLEQGAAAAMEAAKRRQSPHRNHPYSKVASSPGKAAGSASIRALLQAQAQMRQNIRLAHAYQQAMTHHQVLNQYPSPSAITNLSQSSGATSPVGGPLPIMVTPDSPVQESNRGPNETSDTLNGLDEQEEALDFSNVDKTLNETGDGDLVIDESPSPGDSPSGHVTPSGTCKVKDEPGYDENSHLSDNSDLSHVIAQNASHLTSTPVNYHSPFAAAAAAQGYSLMDGITSLQAYQGMNLSLSSGYVTSNGSGSPDRSLSVQYTSAGPITVGINGQNVSNSPRVKDIILYDDQSPLKQQKGSKVVQEGDFMLDKLGLDPKRRRRRSPDETLTSDEIAEYMGATTLANNTGIMFKCKYCSEEMEDLVRYLQHTLTVHNAYICHQCGKSFTTKSSLLRHRPIHTGLRRFACSICKKTFYRKDKCKSHIKRHLGPGDQNVDQYQQIEPVPELPE